MKIKDLKSLDERYALPAGKYLPTLNGQTFVSKESLKEAVFRVVARDTFPPHELEGLEANIISLGMECGLIVSQANGGYLVKTDAPLCTYLFGYLIGNHKEYPQPKYRQEERIDQGDFRIKLVVHSTSRGIVYAQSLKIIAVAPETYLLFGIYLMPRTCEDIYELMPHERALAVGSKEFELHNRASNAVRILHKILTPSTS